MALIIQPLEKEIVSEFHSPEHKIHLKASPVGFFDREPRQKTRLEEKGNFQPEHGKISRLGSQVFVLISGQDAITINANATGFLYRFCTADPAFGPFLVFLLFGESITYMLSTLLHDPD